LKVEIKRVNFEKEVNEKIKEIKKAEGDDEVLMEGTDPYGLFYSAKYGLYWSRPHIKDLLENKIVEINQEGELMIDPEFRKTMNKLVKRFKKIGLAIRQVDN